MHYKIILTYLAVKISLSLSFFLSSPSLSRELFWLWKTDRPGGPRGRLYRQSSRRTVGRLEHVVAQRLGDWRLSPNGAATAIMTPPVRLLCTFKAQRLGDTLAVAQPFGDRIQSPNDWATEEYFR